MTTSARTAVRVVSEPACDGTYVVTVHPSDDVSVPLDADRALAYARALIRVANHAEYDAAVAAQLRAAGVDQQAIARAITGLRRYRPPVGDHITAPLRFTPGVSGITGRPFVHVDLRGRRLGQWTIAAAHHHAVGVLDTAEVVKLDRDYHRWLTRHAGVEEPTARATVDQLRQHRHGRGHTATPPAT